MPSHSSCVPVSLFLDTAYDLKEEIQKAENLHCDSITVPLVHWNFDREFVREPVRSRHVQFTRSELVLRSEQWIHSVICRIGDNLNLDSQVENIQRQAVRTMLQEISFAEHVCPNGFIYMKLNGWRSANLARTVACRPIKGTLLVEVPMTNPLLPHLHLRRDIDEDVLILDPWQWWNNFRTYGEFNQQIKLALELTPDAPDPKKVQRWLGEPVGALVIPSNVFISNANSYPVLSRTHQSVLKLFHQTVACQFILKANPSDGHVGNYVHYIKHLFRNRRAAHPLNEFDDVPQIPLQPLIDNLDSVTYDVFERDPSKYRLYQEAIERALIDRVPEADKDIATIVVMVVGGGRGPLVRAVLNASDKTQRRVKLYVIEKNPNVLVTLVAMINELWSDRNIEVISIDMRQFNPPIMADIIVSELLGSFGDNELSPECLDGAQRYLKDDGVSIPSGYTSFLHPCFASAIYNHVRNLERCNSKDRADSARYMEQMYVACQKNVYHIDHPVPVFEFIHPRIGNDPNDNSRYYTLRFRATIDCMLNGFSGSFLSVLYEDVTMSIHPYNHTMGMASWFPMFFPLSEPVYVQAGDPIVLEMWRRVEPHKVWYEWCLSSPIRTHVHNLNGRGHPIWQ